MSVRTFSTTESTGTWGPLLAVPPGFPLQLPSGRRTKIPMALNQYLLSSFSSAEAVGFLSSHLSLLQPHFSLPSSSGTPAIVSCKRLCQEVSTKYEEKHELHPQTTAHQCGLAPWNEKKEKFRKNTHTLKELHFPGTYAKH